MVLRWQSATSSIREASYATLIRFRMPTTGLVMFGSFVKTRCVSHTPISDLKVDNWLSGIDALPLHPLKRNRSGLNNLFDSCSYAV